jgi:hypothetical protein
MATRTDPIPTRGLTVALRSEAFAVQARSDLDAYEAICRTGLPTCHQLHYLQMWLEKLCKAYLWLPGAGGDELRFQHNVVAKVLPQLVREHWRRIEFTRQPDVSAIRALCREVDLLHPQVDDAGRRPDNVEYPWITSDGVAIAPAEARFAIASRLYAPAGKLLLKAAVRLTRDPAILLPTQGA